MPAKPKRVIQEPLFPPNSFTRAEAQKVIKEVIAARKNRQKQAVPNESK